MCEMLVRVKDKPLSGDSSLDVQRTMRGDVIVVCEDKHDWSKDEINNPEWQILKCPDMTVDEGLSYTSPEPPDDVRRYFRKRLFKINIDDPSVVASFSGGSGSDPNPPTTSSGSTIRNLKQTKPQFVDGQVIGMLVNPRVVSAI